MKEIDKLGWLFIKDNNLLCARSRGKALYYVPGGKRDPGESDHAALIREIKEELTVDLLPETIKYAGTFTAPADEKHESIPVKVTCFYAEFEGDIKAAAEIEEVKWLNSSDKEKCSSVTQQIINWLHLEAILK